MCSAASGPCCYPSPSIKKSSLLAEMNTERKRTELSGATFVFIFFCESGYRYGNFEQIRKQILTEQTQTEYGVDTDEN
jgi:hypothetical protein